jgi:hypothetical protein
MVPAGDMNKRFITNDEGQLVMMLGFDFYYNMMQGILRISHATAIMGFVHKHSMEKMNPGVVPCTVDLQKQIKTFKYANTPGEAEETEAIISLPNVSGSDGPLATGHIQRCRK